jgi:hypothetical protein
MLGRLYAPKSANLGGGKDAKPADAAAPEGPERSLVIGYTPHQDPIVIMSYEFAARRADDERLVSWDPLRSPIQPIYRRHLRRDVQQAGHLSFMPWMASIFDLEPSDLRPGSPVASASGDARVTKDAWVTEGSRCALKFAFCVRFLSVLRDV